MRGRLIPNIFPPVLAHIEDCIVLAVVFRLGTLWPKPSIAPSQRLRIEIVPI